MLVLFFYDQIIQNMYHTVFLTQKYMNWNLSLFLLRYFQGYKKPTTNKHSCIIQFSWLLHVHLFHVSSLPHWRRFTPPLKRHVNSVLGQKELRKGRCSTVKWLPCCFLFSSEKCHLKRTPTCLHWGSTAQGEMNLCLGAPQQPLNT